MAKPTVTSFWKTVVFIRENASAPTSPSTVRSVSCVNIEHVLFGGEAYTTCALILEQTFARVGQRDGPRAYRFVSWLMKIDIDLVYHNVLRAATVSLAWTTRKREVRRAVAYFKYIRGWLHTCARVCVRKISVYSGYCVRSDVLESVILSLALVIRWRGIGFYRKNARGERSLGVQAPWKHFVEETSWFEKSRITDFLFCCWPARGKSMFHRDASYRHRIYRYDENNALIYTVIQNAFAGQLSAQLVVKLTHTWTNDLFWRRLAYMFILAWRVDNNNTR